MKQVQFRNKLYTLISALVLDSGFHRRSWCILDHRVYEEISELDSLGTTRGSNRNRLGSRLGFCALYGLW